MHSRYVVEVVFKGGQAVGQWFATHHEAENRVAELKEDPSAVRLILFEYVCHRGEFGVEVADSRRILSIWVREKRGWVCEYQ